DHAQAAPEHEEVEAEEERRADEPSLLGEAREDEVGLALREEAEVDLRCAVEAASQGLAGAHRRDRLLDVVPRRDRTRRRMGEAGQALLLVTLEDADTCRRARPEDAHGDEHDGAAED